MAHRHSPQKSPRTNNRRANPSSAATSGAMSQPQIVKRGQRSGAQEPSLAGAATAQNQKRKHPKKQSHGPKQKHR